MTAPTTPRPTCPAWCTRHLATDDPGTALHHTLVGTLAIPTEPIRGGTKQLAVVLERYDDIDGGEPATVRLDADGPVALDITALLALPRLLAAATVLLAETGATAAVGRTGGTGECVRMDCREDTRP